jgi:hypothetical protein
MPKHTGDIKVFYLPSDAQWNCFKRMLKLTLNQLLLVSGQSLSSESVLFELWQAQTIRSLMMVIEPKHVGADLM